MRRISRMPKMTPEIVHYLYEKGKLVYENIEDKNIAIEEVCTKYPDDIADSSAKHYIELYSKMCEGKSSTWNSNTELLLYYVKTIIGEKGRNVGLNAYRVAMEFAQLKSRKELIMELNNLSKEFSLANGEGDSTITQICGYINKSGFSYSVETIKNLYLSLKSKPFVILAGISGTGKSKIAKMFSEAIGATTENGRYKLIPVRPDWSDSTDLLGHLNLDGKFIPGSVTEFLAEANKEENLDKPFILCLDEMNLARVEYYFSDFLSVIETRSKNSEGRTISEKLLSNSAFGTDKDSMKNYGSIHLSENVYIVGTVNMDETTFPFSKKVLDRANTIEFSDVNLSLGKEISSTEFTEAVEVDNSYLKCEYMKFYDCYSDNPENIEKVIMLLDKINIALTVVGAQVAYRVRDEISYYVTYAQKFELLSFDEAMDNAFLQKILPRIQGSSLSLRGVFRELFKIMADSSNFEDNELLDQVEDYMKHSAANCRFPKSAQKVEFMLRRFEEDGYTSYWL
jgi:5-methylcytosine-specific restriction protein B